MTKNDACSIIKKMLLSGPKTSEELREACKKAGNVNSTFYYHLKQLVQKLREVEEISERDRKGRLIKKYALVKKQESSSAEGIRWSCTSGGVESFTVGDLEIEYPPSRMLLELAAWIRHDPANWDTDDVNVRKAILCLQHCGSLVPDVRKTREDPDKYAFIWSDDALEKLKLDGAVSPRFLDFSSIYDAIEEPLSIGVAVSKEDDALRVVYVETREGKLDEAWVSGLSKHLKAKKTHALDSDSLKEDHRRDLLINLREFLEQRRLLISGRYETLVKDLLEYSYKKPSKGYVLALALAVDLASS